MFLETDIIFLLLTSEMISNLTSFSVPIPYKKLMNKNPSSMTIHFNDGYLDLEEMQNKTTTSGFLMFMITC